MNRKINRQIGVKIDDETPKCGAVLKRNTVPLADLEMNAVHLVELNVSELFEPLEFVLGVFSDNEKLTTIPEANDRIPELFFKLPWKYTLKVKCGGGMGMYDYWFGRIKRTDLIPAGNGAFSLQIIRKSNIRDFNIKCATINYRYTYPLDMFVRERYPKQTGVVGFVDCVNITTGAAVHLDPFQFESLPIIYNAKRQTARPCEKRYYGYYKGVKNIGVCERIGNKLRELHWSAEEKISRLFRKNKEEKI